jgi:large subunit ribosomal protein L25
MAQDVINLSLDAREVTGKGVKHLRKAGTVPAVIHDHGKPSINVQGDAVALLKAYRLAGKHHPIALKAAGKTYTAMIKDAEFEPRRHQLNHIVFNAVAAGQKVEAEVPVHAQYGEGNEASPAERNGLMVISNLDVVLVEALPNNLPDVIYYDAEKLVEVGDHISVADLLIPANVEVKTDPQQGVASVFEPSAIAAANDAAGGDADESAAAAEAVPAEQGSVDANESAAAKATAE